MPYFIEWHAGPTSQLEVGGSRDSSVSAYQLKYTPAFRITIRPPLDSCRLGPKDLTQIAEDLETLAARVRGRSIASSPIGARPDDAAETLRRMQTLGSMLLELTVPPYVEAELRPGGQFIEIGFDESLLSCPWELMHDGEDFLCMKHAVGRFVNNVTPPAGMMSAPSPKTSFPELSVLVVSVPAPLPRDDRTFERLPSVEAEAEAIFKAIDSLPGVKGTLLTGNNATYDRIYGALRDGHQIIHFCGHAFFDEQNPRESGLVLQDRDMRTGAIVGFLTKRRPLFCFVNGCESARSGTAGDGAWHDSYNIYSLARAFMDTGAYLLGSRWKVADDAAATFAGAFYRYLLEDAVPIGKAVQQARSECRLKSNDAFAWASYILYGDPRVCFRWVPPPQSNPASP